METALLEQQSHALELPASEVAATPAAEVLTNQEVEAGMAELTAYLDNQVPAEVKEYLRAAPSRKGPPGRDNPNSNFVHA